MHYPFHPLAGRELRARRRFKGPPEVLVLEADGGNELWVPSWMTEPGAAECQLGDTPRVAVSNLLSIAALVKQWRESQC